MLESGGFSCQHTNYFTEMGQHVPIHQQQSKLLIHSLLLCYYILSGESCVGTHRKFHLYDYPKNDDPQMF